MTFQPSEYSYGETLEYGSPLALGLGLGVGVPLLIGVLALPTFVITPLILKAVVPKWPYSRRLIGGIGLTMAGGFIYRVAKAAGGQE